MSIGLSIVEEVHAGIIRASHTLYRNLFTDLATVSYPGAQRKFAKLNPRTTKSAIIHVEAAGPSRYHAVNIRFRRRTSTTAPGQGFDNRQSSEPDRIGREFDEDACDFCDRYQKRGLSPSSKLLLTFFLGEGVHGKSVVDLGCGAGGFSIQLLKEGASSAAGFDLSQNMINSATELARSEGFEAKTKFQVGNAATAELPPSDIVLMDKVLCCYSDWQLLLKNAISASQEMIGFIVPRDVGIARVCFRVGVRIVNYFANRKGNTLFYLHPLGEIDNTFQKSGFTLRKKQTQRFWLAFLYSRQ